MTAPTPTSAFPIVSFAPFLSGTPEGKQKVAQELYDAFHMYGWVYLKDFGIEQETVDEMFRRSKSYFDLPLSEKLKHRLRSASENQGYTADGDESNGGVDHKECYEHRRFRNELCPAPGELDGFREFMDGFYQQCHTLSHHLLQALSLSLSLPPTYIPTHLKNADPQLRLLHYPPLPPSQLQTPNHSRINPHTDFGLCTILFQDEVGGLEVDPFHTDEFVQAVPIRGTVVINMADLGMRLSNGRFRSTRHRVVSPSPASLATEEHVEREGRNGEMLLPARYSTAFFNHPNSDTIITPILVNEGETSRYEPVNAGEWRAWNTSKNYSSRGLSEIASIAASV
ncbi:MAG: hypothetical protein M1834_006432 [Cirrosporium novae-zelandiae]|nr:MAG: hypothetical protein M1834_006432 [Cirrosporium novae-zelandiae]